MYLCRAHESMKIKKHTKYQHNDVRYDCGEEWGRGGVCNKLILYPKGKCMNNV